MRQGHLFMVFLFIVCGCFASLYCKQKYYDSIIQEKQAIESALLEAVEYTGNMSRIVLREGEEQKKQLIADSFSEAIYISMGYLETPVPKEFWRLYVPMLVLVEEDGAYFYHVQTGQAEGEKELYHVWTDKFLFSFPEGCNDIKKKSLMANVLEQKASEIITEHNSIALQHGISYQYYLPGFFQNTLQLPEFPMLFVVFQGWPLNCFSVFYDACFEVGVFMHYKGNMESDYPKLIDP